MNEIEDIGSIFDLMLHEQYEIQKNPCEELQIVKCEDLEICRKLYK